jgi:hypothetical protein
MVKNNTEESAPSTLQAEHAEAIIVLLLQLVDAGQSTPEAKTKTKEKVAVLLSKVMPKSKAARLMGMKNNTFYDIVNKKEKS